MDSAAFPVAVAPAAPARTAARTGAWLVLLGTAVTTVGVSWDIQWHVEVGPDSFFTLPHLLLYLGSALSGLASLTMVLLATSAQRAGRPWPRSAGGPPVRVLGGAFHAPLGYLVAGAGAASFLLYGLMDLWWHSIYGFDAVLDTPSHVALFLSICVTMVGGVVAFAAGGDQGWARAGILVGVPILILFAPTPFNALDGLPPAVNPTAVGSVLCAPTLLLMGALLLRRGGALGIALVLGAMQALLWWFSPWAAKAYAAAVGLPLREGLVPRAPQLPASVPVLLVAAALVIEAGWWLRGRAGGTTTPLLLAVGAVSGIVVGASLSLQLDLASPARHLPVAQVAAPVLLGIPLGLLAGYLGPRLAAMLRTPIAREEY
ncbi:hypothetical protein AB0J86_14995 [Micromonospora sp. NPDC049559]|uniref:hypothetical protein n=1 Tax=Micromonospora sp. NPDC049559 TaxID=3155923 RepID=UPI0034131551